MIDIEIDEFPDGDPRGGLQRALGWHVVRVLAWQVYLEPDTVVYQVLQELGAR